MTPARRFCRSALAACFAVSLVGCASSGPNVNDELRKKNDELQREVEKVTRQLKQREQELSTLRGQGGKVIADADIPVVTKLEFGRYSGGADTNKDEFDDTLRVYLSTSDQNNRFIVVAGEAVLQAVLIKPESAPVMVVEKKFSAKEFDKAFRSGFTGTHYTLEAPLPPTMSEDMKTLTVKVTLTDATTGKVLSLEKPMEFRIKK